MRIVIRTMELGDVPEIGQIEKQTFSSPWPAHAYGRELRENRLAHYIVAKRLDIEPSETPEESTPPSPQSTGIASSLKQAVRRFLQLQEFGPPAAGPEPTIVGYAGFWLMVDEAHVTTIAVRPELKRRGVGELLFVSLIDLAIAEGAKRLTLEVRISNTAAQQLYKKYGLTEEGLRRHYYTDNGEDALIMTSPPFDSPTFQDRIAVLKRELNQKLASLGETTWAEWGQKRSMVGK
ncbi:MAG: ribosomal protein S18-alanine N-acetyltransferase [Chloroflexi bacterium]|nr:ribosomal protein S18-alanine N-acetyltransferase [Chloroflexota bacterium]MCL5076268.1 ribosomal protein S18-alanine N-acetyltransferase [Chloroflexota bacterium]